LTADRFAEILDSFGDISLAVIGDYFLDKYLIIDPDLAEPSVETGLDAHQVVAKRISPGAAGTVVANLHALGVGLIKAIGVTGCDGEGFELRMGLQQWSADIIGLMEDPGSFTPTYTKPMLKHSDGTEQEINRIDIRNRRPLSKRTEDILVKRIWACVDEVDGIIIADQVAEPDLGVISPRVREVICQLGARRPETPLLVDSRASIGQFADVIIKPNASEGARAAGLDVGGEISTDQAAEITRRLAERTGRTVYLTLGENGIAVRDGEEFTHIPGYQVAGPIDIVGAGDSTTAGIVPALCAGASAAEAGLFGNLAASITVQQIGTTGTAAPEQMTDRFAQYQARYNKH